MLLGDLNVFFLIFFLIFFSIIINTNTSLHLLLTAEILWITLFSLTLLCGLFFDNNTILSLTFFFLVFSAIELGIGLVLLVCQNIFNRSISLVENDTNFMKFSSRFKNHLYINKLNWKL